VPKGGDRREPCEALPSTEPIANPGRDRPRACEGARPKNNFIKNNAKGAVASSIRFCGYGHFSYL
jgi:hypothetical protein